MKTPYKFQTGKLRQDNSNHWYLIPELYYRTFDVLSVKLDKLDEDSDEWYKVGEELEKNFGQYRLPGGLFDMDLDVIIEE